MELRLKGVSVIIGLFIMCFIGTIDNEAKLTVKARGSKAGCVEAYGAAADDDKDDTKAIQQAIEENEVISFKNGGKYIISRPILVKKNTILCSSADGGAPAKIVQTKKQSALMADAPVKATIRLKGGLKAGEKSIKVSATAGIRNNSIIKIQSDKLWYWDHRNSLYKGEVHKVQSYSKDTLNLCEGLFDSYDKSENLTVTVFEPMELEIRGLEFSHPSPVDTVMISIRGVQASKIRDIKIKNSKQVGLKVINCYDTNINSVYAELGTTKDVDTGYGIQDYGSVFTTIQNCKLTAVRRGIDFSGTVPSRHGRATNNTAYGPKNPKELAAGNSGFGTHSTASNILFKNNTSYNFQHGYVSRGEYVTFDGNKSFGSQESFLYLTYGNDVAIKNNERLEGNYITNFIKIGNTYNGSVTISNNKAVNCENWVSDSGKARVSSSDNIRIKP